ncbi:hypothetical protein [Flavobacterium sp. MK4S-17]|uniref:RipA family octameric membrane protein n=1 Tax=Flavobacterium sp. MK4S-17 TaxID=2543737 RepID=UPI001357C7EE|nr:hypothetical protein [Flavobacterium sp. MK4S-17]
MSKKTKNKISNEDFEKYKILITARNFHYDNFNKWASYFYVAIGAILVAYYTVVCSEYFENKKLLEFLIISLGFTFSCLWYWSMKGYYYWNINFITLVNNYEKEIFGWTKKKESILYMPIKIPKIITLVQ